MVRSDDEGRKRQFVRKKPLIRTETGLDMINLKNRVKDDVNWFMNDLRVSLINRMVN